MTKIIKSNRIDYSKYEVDEVAETISDAIFFPLYIGKVLGLTVLIASVLLFIYAYFQNEYILLVILLFLLFFIVSLPSIILISAIRLINTIRDDLNKVITITTETAIHVYNDTRQLGYYPTIVYIVRVTSRMYVWWLPQLWPASRSRPK